MKTLELGWSTHNQVNVTIEIEQITYRWKELFEEVLKGR